MTLTTLTTMPGATVLSVRAAGADGMVTPGVLGFTVVALLGLTTYLLIRSMNRRIKRIDLAPQEMDVDTASDDPAGQRPAGDGPAGQRPAGDGPVGQRPVGDDPVSGEPDRP